MKKKLITSVSIAFLAIFGTLGVAKTIQNNDNTRNMDSVSTLSAGNEKAVSTDPENPIGHLSGGTLQSISESKLTFDFTVKDKDNPYITLNSLLHGEYVSSEMNGFYSQDNVSLLLNDLSVSYMVNDTTEVYAPISNIFYGSAEADLGTFKAPTTGPHSIIHFINDESGNDFNVYDNSGGYAKVVRDNTLRGEIDIIDPTSFSEGNKISEVKLVADNPDFDKEDANIAIVTNNSFGYKLNDVFSYLNPALDWGFYISESYKNSAGDTVYFNAEDYNFARTSQGGWFNIPKPMYVDDSLAFGDFGKDYMTFSYELNGRPENFTKINPTVTFEENNNVSKQRIMSYETLDAPEFNPTTKTTKYSYKITGISDPNSGGILEIQPNKEYSNIRVYLNVAPSDIQGGYLSNKIDPTTSLDSKKQTITTIPEEPTYKQNSLEINSVSQKNATLSVEFNASGVEGDTSIVPDWSKYGKINKDDITLAVSANSSAANKINGGIPTGDGLIEADWVSAQADGTFVKVNFALPIDSLEPNTDYIVYLQTDPNQAGYDSIGKFTTTDYNNTLISNITISPSYRNAEVQLSINDAPGEYQDFNARNVVAYYDWNGTDGKKFDISYVGTGDNPKQYKYTLDNLNPFSIQDGVQFEDVAFGYYRDGKLEDNTIVEYTGGFSTEELLDPTITTDSTTDKFEVIQTGQSITTINIELPGLNSAGHVDGVSGVPIEAYTDLKYGENFQFALTDKAAKTNPSQEDILTNAEVSENTPTKFIIDLSDRLAQADPDKGSASINEYTFRMATLDPSTGDWVWKDADKDLYTNPLKSPEVIEGFIIEDSQTMNDVEVEFKIKSANPALASLKTSTYAEFNPLNDITFKAVNEESSNDLLSFDYDEASSSYVTEGTEIIGTYHYKLHNLRAGTKYYGISASVQGGKWEDKITNFTTDDKYSVGFHDDTTHPGHEVELVSTTFDSVTFNIWATTGGNYKTLQGDDLKDVEIRYMTYGGPILPTSWEIQPVKASNPSNSYDTAPGGYYNHEDYEKDTQYQITAYGIDDPTYYYQEITELWFYDLGSDAPATRYNSIKLKTSWQTTERLDIEFPSTSYINILTKEGDENSTDGFDFSFELNYGGKYMDFDPEAPFDPYLNPYTLNFYAKEGSSQTFKQFDMEFVGFLGEDKGSTHKLHYRVSGLKSATIYSEIQVVIDSDPTDPALTPNQVIEYNGTYTTSELRAPILKETFKVNDSDIEQEGFIFSISAVEGSEQQEIINENYNQFKPEDSFLGYKDEKFNDVKMETKFLSSEKQDYSFGRQSVSYVTYRFSTSGLESGKTYSNLFFNYNGKVNGKVELKGSSVTTKKFKNPYDPNENPVEFDYETVTSESFQFSIDVISVANKGVYSSFAEGETLLFANNRQLKTSFIKEQAINTDEGENTTLTRYTYEVSGLTEQTTYTDFALVLNAYGGTTKSDANVLTKDKTGENTYYTTIYKIPYVSIRTHKDMHNIAMTLTVSLVTILLIIILFIIYGIYSWWQRHISLTVFAHPDSMPSQKIILRIRNGIRHKGFWNAHPDEMKLYAQGEELEAMFLRDLDGYGEPTGDFRVVLTNVVGNFKKVMFLTAAIKYNAFEVSWEEGGHVYKLNSVKDKKIRRVLGKEQESDKEKYEKLLKKYAKDKGHGRAVSRAKQSHASAVFLINRYDSTSTSMRYEAVIPAGHPLTADVDMLKKKLKLYYQIDDKLYPFKLVYLGNEGPVYKWDIVDLQPGTIYPGIHWTLDGEKLAPSLSNFGKTKDENGKKVKIKYASLPTVPKVPNSQIRELPRLSAAIQYLGNESAARIQEISVQKHIQRDTGIWLAGSELESKLVDYLKKWYIDADALSQEIELDTNFIRAAYDPEAAEAVSRKTAEDKLKVKKEKEEAKKQKQESKKLSDMTKGQLMKLACEEYEKDSLKGYSKEDLIELLGGDQ